MTAPQQLEPPSQNAGDTATTYSGTDTLFSMYITRVTKFEDEKDVENWKGGADSILVFTGLFSSTVATFIALSYPNLQQDPNLATQLLTQISQQLSNSTTSVGQSVHSSYVGIYQLSLVPQPRAQSHMRVHGHSFATMGLQIPPHNSSSENIHTFTTLAYTSSFSEGARRFGIFGFVEIFPLLLLSMFLFFAGLVVFAFRGNATVAYFTVGIVGFSTISYIAFTLMLLIFHDCPYQTPLTSVLWFFSQIIQLSIFSVLYHGAKHLHERWGTVSLCMVKSFRDRQKKTKSLSETIISKLENSAGYISVDVYKKPLVRMLHWLNDDHELEEYVAGIPGLYWSWSDALATRNDVVAQRTMSKALAALPGSTSFHASLSWSIIYLAQQAVAGDPPNSVQQQRTRACLRALCCIPGAIRDVLAPYVVRKYYCLEIFPLLNSPESLDIIDELWDMPIRDIALSVRRLRFGPFAPGTVAPDSPSLNDTTRLQNLGCFLADIKDILGLMHTDRWTSNNADSIRRERQPLFDARHTVKYLHGRSMFDLQGDRTSPAFMPAAQQDLITLTLEILARDPVADAAMSQRDAFHDAYEDLVQVTSPQSWWARGAELVHIREIAQARPQGPTLAQVPLGIELKPLSRTLGADSVVARALEPVLTSLRLGR
ncbi:hypothetical protein EDB92DRAFT_1994639 [Lactarius akahatsu]|uniref:DUF6535 domain-containing protein n=1 Tax=Lactarius akahatsu TaxID=416441 RepID=A0AAD4QDF9_9AGAM|nr:hypothetical protein EDB92DRAFT_1994639 [Lactarius akahatsu]